MPNPKGAVLTERDRALLAYVGIARYASAEQVHRLFFEGSSRKQTYRRLAKLCTPGSKLGEDACLRRLQYRRRDGTAVPVWALTGYGRGLAEEAVPYLRPPAASDIGHRFLQHTLLLNDVLAGLVSALRPSASASLSTLPFRWLSEDDGVLEFEVDARHPVERVREPAVLKPDGILEIPGRSRRLFLEAETGTQSIATAQPARTGAVLAKLQRYAAYFTDFTKPDRKTWYDLAFPDGFTPLLVFIVHSRDRRQRVAHAVEKWLQAFRAKEYGHPLRFQVLVLTFAEAASALASHVSGSSREATSVPAPTAVHVDPQKVQQAREAFNTLLRAMKERWRAVQGQGGTPPAPAPAVPTAAADALRALRDFLELELAAATPPGPTASSATTR